MLPGRTWFRWPVRRGRRWGAAKDDRVDGADDLLLHGEVLVDGEVPNTHSADIDILQVAIELAAPPPTWVPAPLAT